MTTETTPDPAAVAREALVDDLRADIRDGINSEPYIAPRSDFDRAFEALDRLAALAAAASPHDPRALAIGTAWLAAEDALPEPGELQLMLTAWKGRDPLYEAVYESQRTQCGEASRRLWQESPDPAAALAALTEKLGETK